MILKKRTYLNKITAIIPCLLCCCFLLCPSLSLAGSYTNCIPQSSNSKFTKECPNGQIARNDISVQCVRNQNQNSCINTMPVGGSVARIPEDVCYRNAGWSNKRNHNGIDYAAVKGTPVLAAAAGVASVNMCVSGGGRTVILTHSKASYSSDGVEIVPSNNAGSYRTIYMHLASITVANGAQVQKGQQIGTVGGSSCSNNKIVEDAYGTHLHFEMRDGTGGVRDGSVLDPLCNDIQSLCEVQSSNVFYEGVSTSGYSPDQCRDCTSYPEACQNTGGGVSGDGETQFVQSDSLSGTWEDSSGSSAANQLADTNDGDCRVSQYRSSFDTCIFCGIFKILFNTASVIAKSAYDTLANSVAVLVLVGTALWLAFLILKYVSSFETKDPRNLLKEIFNQLFVVTVVVFLLLGTTSIDFMNLVITPVFQTGMNLANIVLADSAGNTCNEAVFAGIVEDGGLPVAIGKSIICVIDAIQNKIVDIIALGSASICVGFFVESWLSFPLLPHFGYVLTGVVLWITGILFLLIYPWLLIDAMLQLCISVMFLPIAIGSYAFKYTRSMFVGKVWGAFMSAMFMFVFLAIIIAILLMCIDLTVGESFNKTLNESGDTVSFVVILQNIGWWTLNFLKLVFTLLLAWAVMGEAQSFAKEFSSGVGAGGSLNVQGVGQNVGVLAYSGVKGAAKLGYKRGKAILKAPLPLAKELGSGLKLAVQKRRAQNRMKQLNTKGTLNSDGSKTYKNKWGRTFTQTQDGYSYKNIFGQTITKSVTQGPNGKSVFTKTKTHKNGSTTSVSRDGYIKQVKHTDANGHVSEKILMTTIGGNNLIKSDGSLNQVAINRITQNSGFSDDVTKEALLRQLARERFSGFDEANKFNSYVSKTTQTGIDKNGNSFFSVTTQNSDGSKSVLTMTFNQKGNRAMTSWEDIDADGRARKVSSDGIFNRYETYNYKKDGSIDNSSRDVTYSASKYYYKLCGNVVNKKGKVAKGVPIDESLFTGADIEEFADQVASEGTPPPLAGFK